MRALLILLAIAVAFPAVAQDADWNPTEPYIITGQDEPGYRAWYARASWRPVYVRAFNDYLVAHGVGGVVPTWQLLRTASDWHKCAAEPFEVPPSSHWPNLVNSLRYVGAYVEPAIGPVEAVSVYRNPALNACAGGAPGSAHRDMSAVDFVPLRPTSREAMIRALCATHAASGERYRVGLGFYPWLRFHIDSMRYRQWGGGTAACRPIIAPLDAPVAAVPSPVTPPAAPPDPLAPLQD